MSGKTFILTDDALEFVYDNSELIKFRRYWADARESESDTIKTINKVAKTTGMLPDNVLLLALDQIRKGVID